MTELVIDFGHREILGTGVEYDRMAIVLAVDGAFAWSACFGR